MRYRLDGIKGTRLHVETHPLEPLVVCNVADDAIGLARAYAKEAFSQGEAFVYSVHDTHGPEGMQVIFATGDKNAYWSTTTALRPMEIDRRETAPA